ncbi:MAG: TolC family protein, partial [Pseudomonadota bacterium]|nr:TolC family protein [Pseudomonadota bacterium]
EGCSRVPAAPPIKKGRSMIRSLLCGCALAKVQKRPGGHSSSYFAEWQRVSAAAILLLLPVAGIAQPGADQRQHLAPGTAAPAAATPAGVRPALSLQEAVGLAADDQPSVTASQREAAASEEAAVAARVLPDPQLTVGIKDFPVEGENAFSPTADNFTMYTVGLMREQVRRSRREAEAARLRAEAVVSRAEATVEERRIRREVMIAWINAVAAGSKQRLLARLIGDLRAGLSIMEAGITTGTSSPALAFQMRAEIALAEVQRLEASGEEARARAELGRWIGAASQRTLPDTVPSLQLRASAEHSSDVASHPHLVAAEAREQASQRLVDVARTERRPNISWSLMYGFRPEYGDLVSAQVTIPLQINRSRVQNRRISEAMSRVDAARLRTQDARRELDGTYAAALADYRSADAQLSLIVDQALPSLEASFEASEARYAGGQDTLEFPFLIVRRYVEVTIQSVEQQARRARAAAELIYLTQDLIG